MYFVLLAAAVAILAGVVAVAMGWGGELVMARRDLPEVPARARTAAQIAALRLPAGLFGYQREATDAALHAIAELVAERDAEVAGLRQELWRLRSQRSASTAAGPAGAGAGDGGIPGGGPAGAEFADDGDLGGGQIRDGGTVTGGLAAADAETAAGGAAGAAGEVLSGSGNSGGQPAAPS